MSRWRAESGYAGRYAGTGVLNTLVGFAVIFTLMWVGFSPVVANMAGYACGFVLGFVLSKKMVFRSQGGALGEAWRYLAVFAFAFLLNLAVLELALNALAIPAVAAQLAAAGAFTVAMFAMSRLFVFSPR